MFWRRSFWPSVLQNACAGRGLYTSLVFVALHYWSPSKVKQRLQLSRTEDIGDSLLKFGISV